MIDHHAAQNSPAVGVHDIYLPGNLNQKNETAFYFIHTYVAWNWRTSKKQKKILNSVGSFQTERSETLIFAIQFRANFLM